MLGRIKKLIPHSLFKTLQPIYHYLIALLGALIYRFPGKKLTVIGITGTKGKSSTGEILNAILEEAGYTTALSGTIRFKIGSDSKPNLYKMSMPGRFFMQKFLHEAVAANCDYAIIEITSEGARQWRHKWINLDALIFTNLSPEHIESHGSYENYKKAKLSIAKSLTHSKKRQTFLVANSDDKEAEDFLAVKADTKITFSLNDAKPYKLKENSLSFEFEGEKITSPLQGEFNLYNILGAATLARALGIKISHIKNALSKFNEIQGRVQKIKVGQDFEVVVDYAHTIDSLEKLYQAFPSKKKICVLGNTGGGRDKWKRPGMAKIAEKYCEEIILTNEDPYDEDPRTIVEEMREAITEKPVEIIMDRREAIKTAITKAEKDSVVLISGKGTDPYIMGKNDSKIPWSDAEVAKEELEKIKKASSL